MSTHAISCDSLILPRVSGRFSEYAKIYYLLENLSLKFLICTLFSFRIGIRYYHCEFAHKTVVKNWRELLVGPLVSSWINRERNAYVFLIICNNVRQQTAAATIKKYLSRLGIPPAVKSNKMPDLNHRCFPWFSLVLNSSLKL